MWPFTPKKKELSPAMTQVMERAAKRLHEAMNPKPEPTIVSLKDFVLFPNLDSGEVRQAIAAMSEVVQKDIWAKCLPLTSLFYIQDVSRGYVGNSPMWWKPNSAGYTSDLSKAGAYTLEQCRKIAHDSDNVFWPRKYIESLPTSWHVDMQDMDKGRIIE